MARDEGWLAEHMLILKLTSPEGRRFTTSPPPSPAPAARPTSPCCSRPLPGWKAETVGDDICLDAFRRRRSPLCRSIPSTGFFGVAPGTSEGDQQANALDSRCTENCIFTNVALTADGDVWWEGLTKHAAGGT